MDRDFQRANSFEGIAVPTAVLEEAALFEGLSGQELFEVAAVMRFRSFEAGAVICREGQPGDSMYVVVDGLVHLLRSLAHEPEVRTRSIFDEGRLVGKLRSGEVLGTGALLTGEPRSATAKAAVDTDLLELGRDAFRELIARFPVVLENLTAILTRRLAEATSRQAHAGRRGEAVALVGGGADATDAAAAASPGSVAVLDGDASLADALDRLDPLLRDNRTVIVTYALEGEELPQLLRHVDRTVAVLESQADADRLAPIAERHGVKGQPIEAVLAPGLELPPGDALKAVHVAGGDEADEAAWVGRHLARAKLGLALGAGGAKGYALVGALYVLEEAGYRIDCVSGSSIGSIVGTWIAFGMGAAEIDSRMRSTFTPEVVAETLKISMSGGSSGHKRMVELVRELAAGRTFADTLIPLAIMTADLTDRAPRPLREGPIDEALLGATALAGVFPPHERDGHRLVDGLALDPVPTSAVIEDGADVTVSVNLIPRETLDAWPGQAPPEPQEERKRRPGMLDTLLEVMDLAQLDTSERNAALADVPITPRFGPGSWRDFDLADLFLAAGREAASERMPELAALAKPQFAGVTTT
jgi:predicted acylesterase/phospholipase RssA/CRP-like cAMP-binding protein